MWIKNFTPAGFVGYLATNYGYDKLMQLAEGNIEQGKKNLTQFFVNHDQDITQEQAAYLANFTMHILTDVGGRAVFHHAAAKGWQKVGRGKKKSETKKKPEDKPKQERAAEKQSTEQQGKKQDAKKAKGQEKQTKAPKKGVRGTDGVAVGSGVGRGASASAGAAGSSAGGAATRVPGKSRLPELKSGQMSESDLMGAAEKWLGEGYKDMGGGRYLSKDSLRQFRYGEHEVKTLRRQHAHFEAYNKPYNSGGKLIEKTVVDVIY